MSVYPALVRAALAGQAGYRASFAFEVLGSVLVVLLDFVELYAVLRQVPRLEGLDLGEVVLVFGLASTGFSLADLVIGQIDRVTDHVRTGTLDVLLLRPLPLLAQLAAADVQLRRVGRLGTALVVLAVALVHADVDWTPARAGLLVLTPLAGAAIFASLFVAAGAVSFWVLDGREIGNALTYGSGYLSQYPTGVLGPVLGRFFTFVIPAAFTGYLPALALLGRDDPAGLPGWLPWASPLAALVAMALAGLCWRAGTRHYVGAGG
jgi:ABC-2 type transport system permease protein